MTQTGEYLNHVLNQASRRCWLRPARVARGVAAGAPHACSSSIGLWNDERRHVPVARPERRTYGTGEMGMREAVDMQLVVHVYRAPLMARPRQLQIGTRHGGDSVS